MGEISLNRRQFLLSVSVVAGGMALGITSARAAAVPAAHGPWGPDAARGAELSAWIEIAPDDTVTLRVPTPEIGNGAMTQVAMNVTEELACAWTRVKVELASIHRDYIEKGIYTSGFLPFFGGHGTDKERMRHALQLGASARERLKAAAAARWNVPVAEIEAKDSLLTHRPSGRTLRYGEVAAEAARITLPAEPALKPRREWSFLGKASPAKLGIPEIATGAAVFGIDVKVPGMVHAALMQAPVHGGKLKSHKPDAVLSMPGVRAVVVVDPARTRGTNLKPQTTFGIGEATAQSGIAVIADHYWQAKLALDVLPVEWDPGPGAMVASAGEIYTAMRAVRDKGEGKVALNAGDISVARGTRIVEGDYSTPYCENATLEPLNGTAMVTADGVEVWCPTQDSQQAFWVTIDETGMAPEQVRIHPTYVGGGFGRRTQSDDIRMVVAVAREFPGVPVKVIWSREECFRQGRYRTPIATRFRAVLDDATGLPQAVTADNCFAGDRPLFHLNQGYTDSPYFHSGIIPNVRLTTNTLPVHVLNGAYRGPCFNSNAFFTETFIDECAIAAGIDPLEYRLQLLTRWDKPWSDCLRIAAAKAGWGQKLPRGEGIGIAITSWPSAAVPNVGTVICAAARVVVTPQGELRVKQVDVTFDCGSVANRDAVHAQMEGGTIFGMNMSLNEELTIRDGRIAEGNFHEYPMLRLGDHLPQINVHFDALSGHERFDIIGEAPIGPVGPAIGNAIFQATGKRLRSTPLRKHDLSWT